MNNSIKVFILLLAACVSEALVADCHFIRLNGYTLTQRPDFIDWGQLSPLIGLEAGYFYHLSPSGMQTTGFNSGEVKDLQGELYYIPQHLIDNNNQFSLRIIVIERDSQNDDDMILPLRERPVSLAPELFTINQRRVEFFYRPFGELPAKAPRNEQAYQFNILKNAQDCSLTTAQGRANDWRYRQENELKRLRNWIRFYLQDSLSGAQEYLFYRLPLIKERNFSTAIKIAYTVAAVNSNELLSLGYQLEKLKDVERFKLVWEEYRQLIRKLFKQNLTIKYYKEKTWEEAKVPSLGFHPRWKKLIGTQGLMPPKKWNIILSQ